MLFKKSQLGWRLMRQSLSAFKEHKNSLILPFIGHGFFFLIILAIIALSWIIRLGKIDYQQLSTAEVLWGYTVILTVLFIGNVIRGYCNAALIIFLDYNEQGQPISVLKSLRLAASRLGTIVLWFMLYFTLGLFVMIFHETSLKIRRLHQLLSGLTWSSATFLVLAVLVNERQNIWKTIHRSSQLLADYAGNSPKVQYSFTMISFGIRLIALLPAIIGAQISNHAIHNIGFVITVVLFLLITIFFNAIFVSLLQAHYQKIAHQKTIRYFSSEDLDKALLSKRSEA